LWRSSSIATVLVKARQLHTYHGASYDVGATYLCDEQDLDTVEEQGHAVRAPSASRGAYKTAVVGERRTTDLADPTPKK